VGQTLINKTADYLFGAAVLIFVTLYLLRFNPFKLFYPNLVQRFACLIVLVSLCLISTAQQQDEFGRINNKFPVTSKPFNDNAAKLQFAIVSDLWGGNRPGVFEDAVDKLNLLQPQFVISVGDLIDGETHDTARVETQWDEFNEKVARLSMPFFYVPGNHDIYNADMQAIWEHRFGRSYYYFVYKNALFLIVNTQDGGASGVKEQQINYFRKVIAEHSQVRWTFVFMHRPVWQGENQKEEGYEKIESALKDRNYTLFSGHHHTYLYNVKNGKKHFVLGTTGGGIELRGEKFGEYDHVTLVTLNNNDDPKIVNLKLSGIIKEDVVNEKTFPLTQSLINQEWISVPVTVLPHQFEKSVTSEIIFSNPAPSPITISGNLPKIPGYTISPATINMDLAPGSKKNQQVTITATDKSDIDISMLPKMDIELNGTYIYGADTFQLPSKKRMKLEWQYRLPQIANAQKIANDQFKNFDSAGFISITNPELLNKWYWHGTNDCLIRFRLIRDAKNLFITAFVTDDQLVTGSKQDVLYIILEDKNGTATRFNIEPSVTKSSITSESNSSLQVKDVALKSTVNANGTLRFLLQVPLEKIEKQDHSFRFNIGYRDQDNHPDIDNATLYWKPVWESENDYKNSGTYILE